MPRGSSKIRSSALLVADTGGARVAEAELIVELLRNIRADAGLQPMLQQLARSLFRTFSCSRILIAAREHEHGQAYLWTAAGTRGMPRHVYRSTLDRSAREAFFAPAPACWCAIRRRRSTRAGFDIVHPSRGPQFHRARWSRFVARSIETVRPAHACIAVACEFGSEWTCRLFVVDPTLNRPYRSAVGLAERLVDALSPALYNVYVAERLRTAAAETERARLARALHDGVIQSLIAAEMEVHAACRRSEAGSTVPARELRSIRSLLHNEVLGLRDLMLRIKPVQIQPEELCDTLYDTVAKFNVDTGITSSFRADVGQASLAAAMCPAVVRIVQEALSNVRKHSGARNVHVSIQAADGQWLLVVEDDGCGLDAAMPVPLVIRECARSLDGELKLLPGASGGLRLELTFTSHARPDGAASARLVDVTNQRTCAARPGNKGDSGVLHQMLYQVGAR